MRVNNFKVSWGSDDSGRVEIGERVFEVDECKVIDREMFEGDEDEVIKFLLEGGWSEVNELWTPKGRPATERNPHIIKEMKVEGEKLQKGDWIVVEGDDWEENGMVVEWDDEEINMFDGKEGWTVKRDEIKKVYFRL